MLKIKGEKKRKQANLQRSQPSLISCLPAGAEAAWTEVSEAGGLNPPSGKSVRGITDQTEAPPAPHLLLRSEIHTKLFIYFILKVSKVPRGWASVLGIGRPHSGADIIRVHRGAVRVTQRVLSPGGRGRESPIGRGTNAALQVPGKRRQGWRTPDGHTSRAQRRLCGTNIQTHKRLQLGDKPAETGHRQGCYYSCAIQRRANRKRDYTEKTAVYYFCLLPELASKHPVVHTKPQSPDHSCLTSQKDLLKKPGLRPPAPSPAALRPHFVRLVWKMSTVLDGQDSILSIRVLLPSKICSVTEQMRSERQSPDLGENFVVSPATPLAFFGSSSSGRTLIFSFL